MSPISIDSRSEEEEEEEEEDEVEAAVDVEEGSLSRLPTEEPVLGLSSV